VVYLPGVHRTTDGVEPSTSDAKRTVEAYLVTEHPGDGNKAARQLVKTAFDLANSVQHDRGADFRDAALCAKGAITAVNTIAILAGQRDEAPPEESAAEILQRRESNVRMIAVRGNRPPMTADPCCLPFGL
jgi:hypothetical protein